MSETTEPSLQLTYADGQVQEILPQDFFTALLSSSRVVEAHISLEEGRQRQQYEGVKRFVSRKLDFSHLWSWVDMVKDPTQHKYARKCLHAAVHTTIMQTEAVMYNELAVSLGRDGLSQCLRDPENPFVQTDDLGQALQAMSTRGGRVAGGRSGQLG